MRVNPFHTALLLTPATVLILVLLVVPVAIVAAMSFTDWQFGAATLDWVGLKNYSELWTDTVFRKSLANTLLYLIVVTLGSIVIGLGAALLIESDTQLRGFYRTAFFMPVASTMIAMAVVWQFLLHPNAGLVNQMLELVGLEPHNWLNDSQLALYSLAAIGIWQMSGLALVLFLAGLKSIPQDIRDAGALDGIEHPLDRFRRITWPLLGPTTLFVVTVCAIRALQVFDTVHVLTKGGPNKATEVLLHTIYSEGFSFFRMGYASAMTVVFIAGIFFLTQLQHATMERKTHY
ncbi:MAG: ABC transporter permease [Polaromonas sp. 39-63-203]|jgi:multiple sugar transport system permease protein|nr:MAG: ABC transporter permease [Polaromonas sp. 35-63-240]OYZ01310.1 MAG: ABC transporter permease [Polaromonas sp. 28-63-22]OYZ84748.1 MAG: ABC transporter permease [Polaromonas sp. 24-62-144]OZA98684.1 MAG: ABC transporter permease [Polaromonas sp. 39-63-203]